MMPATAKLIKHATHDGLMEINDDVPLGKIYRVDLDSRRIAGFKNTKVNKLHSKTIISTIDGAGKVTGYLPLEILQILEN